MSRLQQLTLIRHAHALPAAASEPDKARPLSSRGQSDARHAGHWLRHASLPPDAILCSDARRTQETLAGLQATFPALPAVQLEPGIYEASPGELLAIIEAHLQHHPAIERLWLIGHNPGLEMLLARMQDGTAMTPLAMPPAGIAILALQPDIPLAAAGSARLLHFHAP